MLTFEPDRHIYRWDGDIVPSVSQILDDCGLVSPFCKSKSHAERGTHLHRVLELYDRGRLCEDFISDEARAALALWKEFKKDHSITFTHIEHLLYCPTYRYAGCGDRFTRGAIYDIKTGQIPKTGALQTAGYAIAHFGEDCKHIKRYCVLINPKKRKTYKLEEYTDLGDYIEWKKLTMRWWSQNT